MTAETGTVEGRHRDLVLSINNSPPLQEEGDHCLMTLHTGQVEGSAIGVLRADGERREEDTQTINWLKALIAALLSRRRETTASWPFSHAQWSGVRPEPCEQMGGGKEGRGKQTSLSSTGWLASRRRLASIWFPLCAASLRSPFCAALPSIKNKYTTHLQTGRHTRSGYAVLGRGIIQAEPNETKYKIISFDLHKSTVRHKE
jgi:hypothetical protein